MSYGPKLALATLAFWIVGDIESVTGQTATQRQGNQLQRRLEVTTQIGEQRVARQTEIMRLEKMIDGFGSRVNRLERQLLSMSRIPGITIAEAEAEVEFAEVQLKETQQLLEQGDASDVQVARDRLELVRANGQLVTAKRAFAESQILLELDVAHAERQLLEASSEQEQMERFVAKGYTSSVGLKYRLLDVALAQKQLQLARLRLDAQRELSGEKDAAADTTPPEAD